MITQEERLRRINAVLDAWHLDTAQREDWRGFAEQALQAAERVVPALARSDELLDAEVAARDFARALRRIEDGSSASVRVARETLRRHPKWDCW